MRDFSARLEREKQLSSIEAELRLRDAQRQILGHSSYERLKEKTLKDYWPKNSSPAPFLEDLRLREFANMPLENILRKRSFTVNKLNAILLAVESACTPEKDTDAPLISPKLLEEYLRAQGFELKPIAAKKGRGKKSTRNKGAAKKKIAARNTTSKRRNKKK